MIPNDVIWNFCADRDSLELPKLMRDMYRKYHLNTFVAKKHHAANVKNIENMLKYHYDIDQGSGFKSVASTQQGVTMVLL